MNNIKTIKIEYPEFKKPKEDENPSEAIIKFIETFSGDKLDTENRNNYLILKTTQKNLTPADLFKVLGFLKRNSINFNKETATIFC